MVDGTGCVMFRLMKFSRARVVETKRSLRTKSVFVARFQNLSLLVALLYYLYTNGHTETFDAPVWEVCHSFAPDEPLVSLNARWLPG